MTTNRPKRPENPQPLQRFPGLASTVATFSKPTSVE
jgi:hypothetical protein